MISSSLVAIIGLASQWPLSNAQYSPLADKQPVHSLASTACAAQLRRDVHMPYFCEALQDV